MTTADLSRVQQARRALDEAQQELRAAVVEAEARRLAAGRAGRQGEPSQAAIAAAAGLGSRETVAAWHRAATTPTSKGA